MDAAGVDLFGRPHDRLPAPRTDLWYRCVMDASQDRWSPVAERLAQSLASLADGGIVSLAEPAAQPEQAPRRGLFSCRSAPVVVRYVQYARVDDHVICECVGADWFEDRSFAGWPITKDQDAQLRAAGWKAPEDLPHGVSAGNYRIDLPLEQADRAAALGVQALSVLGVSPEVAWDWQVDAG